MKRIALLSDIHGNIVALKAVVQDMLKRNIDQVINLGDHISGPLWPKETIQFLMKQDWIHIAGNHDKNLVFEDPESMGASDKYAYPFLNEEEKDWLLSMPENLVTTEGFRLFHATPENNNTYLLETVEYGRVRLATIPEISDRLGSNTSKIIFCGHTHIQRVVNLPQNILIVNPGSVGCPAYDDEIPEYHLVETGSPHARYAVVNFDNEIRSIELISVLYDFTQAAKIAKENNRLDWANGLKTGYLR